MQPFTSNGDVSILVKYSRVGRKTPNNQTNISFYPALHVIMNIYTFYLFLITTVPIHSIVIILTVTCWQIIVNNKSTKQTWISIEHNTAVFISFTCSNVYNDGNISLCTLWQVVKSLHCWTKCCWSPLTMINLTKTVNKLMI